MPFGSHALRRIRPSPRCPRPCAIGCSHIPGFGPIAVSRRVLYTGRCCHSTGNPQVKRSTASWLSGPRTITSTPRARERILARLNLRRRSFTSHRMRRPIGLRVHRRIRLQLAHNFRNLIPRNDREPSAHDEPPLILLRVRPAALDFSVIRFRDSYKEGRWNLIYFIRFPGFV